MKRPSVEEMKASAGTAFEWARETGEPIARRAVESGQAALKTKAGKRFATGAAAGAAIGYVVPLLTITTGALLFGGAMLFWKSVQDKVPEE